jgi:glutamate-1-semialdehyde 2,1-aminomutase
LNADVELGSISRERLAEMRDRELRRFTKLRPRGEAALARAGASLPNGVPMTWMVALYQHPPIVVEGGNGATFTDVDGNEYVDFNLADTSMFTGYGIEEFTRAVGDRAAAGPQFLLPGEDAAQVAEELGRRFGLPYWQFTLSATQANTEAIRVARALTGRSIVLMFDGKYHGHNDELLGQVDEGRVAPEGLGLLPDATRHVRLVPYNDLEAVERELARGDVACVIAEAAITNLGVIQPADGFHAGLRRLTSDAETVLVLDETHTLVAGPGGLTAHWGLEPDILVMGKSISGGVPLGTYGMTAEVARVLDDPTSAWGEGVATGGTLFGNALSMAAARVTLTEVLTESAYEHAAALGARLADGIESVAAANELPWRAHRLFNRSGYTHAPELPSNAAEARASFDLEVYNLQRLYMANRGVWEAIDSAGPACGIQTTEAHVDRYLEVLAAFLGEAQNSAVASAR